jgi:hypothetical protein
MEVTQACSNSRSSRKSIRGLAALVDERKPQFRLLAITSIFVFTIFACCFADIIPDHVLLRRNIFSPERATLADAAIHSPRMRG